MDLRRLVKMIIGAPIILFVFLMFIFYSQFYVNKITEVRFTSKYKHSVWRRTSSKIPTGLSYGKRTVSQMDSVPVGGLMVIDYAAYLPGFEDTYYELSFRNCDSNVKSSNTLHAYYGNVIAFEEVFERVTDASSYESCKITR